MGQLGVTINGRNYRVACEDGEEEHLTYLSEYVDKHARELAEGMGDIGETRLILMAALLISDELSESVERIEKLEKELAERKEQSASSEKSLDEKLTKMLDEAGSRLEVIAAGLENA